MEVAWERFAGETLRQVRTERRLSQRELARRAGVTPATISDIERGRRQPTLPLLGRIVTAAAGPRVALRLVDPAGAKAIADAAAVALAEGDGEGALRAVLSLWDLLLRNDSTRVKAVVGDRPALIGEPPWDAFIAAVVEEACARHGIAAPTWTGEPARYCSPARHLSAVPAMHELEEATAPEAFRRHGVYVAAAALESV